MAVLDLTSTRLTGDRFCSICDKPGAVASLAFIALLLALGAKERGRHDVVLHLRADFGGMPGHLELLFLHEKCHSPAGQMRHDGMDGKLRGVQLVLVKPTKCVGSIEDLRKYLLRL
jgi:hypothetical protein